MRTCRVVLRWRCDCSDTLMRRRGFLLWATAPDELGIVRLARVVRLAAVCGLLVALTALPAGAQPEATEDPDGWISDSPNIKTSPCDSGEEPDDITIVPNVCSCPNGTPMWESGDIWVRNIADSLGTNPAIPGPSCAVPLCGAGTPHISTGAVGRYANEHDTQTPKFTTNFVYVKLRSRGTTSVSGTLEVYWAFSATGLSWKGDWDGTVGGGLIGTALIPPLNPCDVWVAEFPWPLPPVSGGPQDHFCLLARFDSPAQDPMAVTEGSNVWNNTIDNNNIAWKNLAVVVDESIGSGDGFLVRNVKNDPANVDLVFDDKGGGGVMPFLDGGSVTVRFPCAMFQNWGGQGQGIMANPNDCSFSLTSSPAKIQGIQMGGDEAQLVTMFFAPDGGNPPPVFQRFVVSQYSDGQTTPDGGVTFEFRFGAPIPTVSEWGLVVLTLLLLIGAKIYFGRRKTATAL